MFHIRLWDSDRESASESRLGKFAERMEMSVIAFTDMVFSGTR
jgi:hypothetical protein